MRTRHFDKKLSAMLMSSCVRNGGSRVEAGGEDQGVERILGAVPELQPARRHTFDRVVLDADDLDVWSQESVQEAVLQRHTAIADVASVTCPGLNMLRPERVQGSLNHYEISKD